MHELYRKVLAIDDASVDQAMAAALPTADSAARRVLALGLLQRRNGDGLLGLVLQFHQLPPDVQQTVVERSRDLTSALRQATQRPASYGPANALAIIEQSRAASLAYLINEMLRHGSDDVRPQAARCLRVLAEACLTSLEHGYNPQLSALGAGHVAKAVHEAIQSYAAHGQRMVLLAMASLLPRPLPATFKLLREPGHPAKAPLKQLIGEAVERRDVRRALLLMLTIEPVSAATAQAIGRCAGQGRLGDIIAPYHLMLLPAVRRRLARLPEAAEAYCPTDAELGRMTTCQRRGMAAWLSTLPMTLEQRIDRLVRLRSDTDAATRLFVLRRLMALAREPGAVGAKVLEHVAGFCRDGELGIARIALWELIGRRYPDLVHVLGELVNSPHAELRRIARRHLSRLGFARLWESWARMTPGRRLAAGRALIKIDTDFHRQLGLKLAGADQATRLRALSVIRELNQGAFFEQSLTHLVHEGDEKAASAAARALGTATTDSAVSSLEKALDHQDSRVRANAIEALAQVKSTRHVKRLLSMAQEEDNRPRANAIAALMQMRTSEAMAALKQMLGDERSQHRLSALWLIETMGLLQLARDVAEMSISDEDSAVKRQAMRVIQEMIELMSPATGGTTADEADQPREAVS